VLPSSCNSPGAVASLMRRAEAAHEVWCERRRSRARSARRQPPEAAPPSRKQNGPGKHDADVQGQTLCSVLMTASRDVSARLGDVMIWRRASSTHSPNLRTAMRHLQTLGSCREADVAPFAVRDPTSSRNGCPTRPAWSRPTAGTWPSSLPGRRPLPALAQEPPRLLPRALRGLLANARRRPRALSHK
jgi:hypothetical protein